MKTIGLCMLCLVLPLAAKQAPGERVELPEGYAFTQQSFRDLKADEASKQAKAMAEKDIKNGITRVLVYGMRRSQPPDEIYLAKTYGVYHVAIAGCVVTDGLVSGANAYNKVVREHLKKLHNKDIFEEARKQAAG